jgi:hypothetical protein
MPYRVGDRESEFAVRVDPEDHDVGAWIAVLLGARDRRWYELEDALCEFVREVAATLALEGEAFFEIVGSPRRCGEGLPDIALARLPFGRVVSVPSKYLQVVPKHLWHTHGAWVALPKDAVWHVALPRRLGSPRQHRRLIRRLNAVSDVVPEFALEDNQYGGSVPGYDFRCIERPSMLRLSI